MARAQLYRNLEFTDEFFATFGQFSKPDQGRFRRAMRLLDTDEKHPSLRMHELHAPLIGVWSASASDALRMTFERLPGGKKAMLQCSRHYRG